MTRSSTFRTVTFLALVTAFPAALLGCPKKQPPVEDAGAAPAATAEAPDVVVLQALTEDDAGDADAEAAAKKWTGPATNPNQVKIQACCNSMRAQAKQLGNSPEAFQITALAGQCDMVAKQVGPGGNAPEFNQLRQMLKSVKLPAACSF
jgi:hypothetical protein